MGVLPHLVLEFGFFTKGSRILTISEKPLQAAICMGVQPEKMNVNLALNALCSRHFQNVKFEI